MLALVLLQAWMSTDPKESSRRKKLEANALETSPSRAFPLHSASMTEVCKNPSLSSPRLLKSTLPIVRCEKRAIKSSTKLKNSPRRSSGCCGGGALLDELIVGVRVVLAGGGRRRRMRPGGGGRRPPQERVSPDRWVGRRRRKVQHRPSPTCRRTALQPLRRALEAVEAVAPTTAAQHLTWGRRPHPRPIYQTLKQKHSTIRFIEILNTKTIGERS